MIQLMTTSEISLADSGEEWAKVLESLSRCGSSDVHASLTLLESVWSE